jgi:hypothetical protein
MFWEFYQQSQINRANLKSGRAERSAERLQRDIESLDVKIEGLALTCQALVELLQEKGGVTEEQLISKMEEVDLRDGKLDGKMSPRMETCRNCQRNTSLKRPTCLYCGERVGY